MAAISTFCMGEVAPEPAGPAEGSAPSAAFVSVLASLQGTLPGTAPLAVPAATAEAGGEPRPLGVPVAPASKMEPGAPDAAPPAPAQRTSPDRATAFAVPATPSPVADGGTPIDAPLPLVHAAAAAPPVAPVALAPATSPVAGPTPELPVPGANHPVADRPVVDHRVADHPVLDHAVVDHATEVAPATVTLPEVAVATSPGSRGIERRPERLLAPDRVEATEIPLPGAAAAPAEIPPDIATAAPPRTLEAAIATQVVERLATLRTDEDGDHELTLQLDPADLGHLDLRVRFEQGVVHVHVDARSSGTADLLRDALPELRAALVDAGLSAGAFDVSNQQAGAGREHAAARDDRAPHDRTDRPIAATRRPVHRIDARGVDVLL